MGGMSIEPRWYQQEAVDSIWRYYEEKFGHPLIGLPGGTGKSYVIAMLAKQIMDIMPSSRLCMLTHVKELITQNRDELLNYWPMAPVGVLSAGLGTFATDTPIVYGSIQTAVNRLDALGHRDVVFVDEAHLISPSADSRYQIAKRALQEKNPYVKFIPLSATMWRLGLGPLVGDLATDVAYDATGRDMFNRILADGYLVPPITPSAHMLTQIDLSHVAQSGRKFNETQLEAVTNVAPINRKIVAETCQWGVDRNCWCIFGNSIDHANKLNWLFRANGIDSDVVHSKRKPEENQYVINRWKAGSLRCIVNCGMLTTGINNRRCDLIAVVRGLLSSAMWVQILSRVTRTCPEVGKRNGLVLDFGNNTARLGPINDPVIPRRPGKGGTHTVPVRVCGKCGFYCHASDRTCSNCGYVFPIQSKLGPEASTIPIVAGSQAPLGQRPIPFNVNKVIYHTNQPKGTDRPPYLKCDYYCGARVWGEHIFLEGKGLAKHHASQWWRARTEVPVPSTANDAVQYYSALRVPRVIWVDMNAKYRDIVKVDF